MSDPLPAPNGRTRRTNYMRQVERNTIRQMMLDGMSQEYIADKRHLSTRQIRDYVRQIRREDYNELANDDQEVRASAIQNAKAEFGRLKIKMLSIVFSTTASNDEVIAAAEMARQFELDLVNLKINGPLALGLRHKNNNGTTVKRYIPRPRQESENIPDSQGEPNRGSDPSPTP